ncbi:MAG: GreA/GreB family elongation factor, partial [Candidatus Doudnabacteria bacterium]|nr:GreA/GreB family elongation factor [Candidatus Doudnabacteria bacterium]
RSLLGTKIGDHVPVTTPSGVSEYEIVSIQ